MGIFVVWVILCLIFVCEGLMLFDYNIECFIYLILRYVWFIYLEDDDFRKYRGYIIMVIYFIVKKIGFDNCK